MSVPVPVHKRRPTASAPPRRAPREVVAALLLILLLIAPPAVAESPRSLAMGGVRLGLDVPNPALAGTGVGGNVTEVPLPVGLLGLATDPRLAFGSDDFDPLTTLDRLSHPFTYPFSPATSPDEIEVRVDTAPDAPPVVTVTFVGGSTLAFSERPVTRFSESLDLALGGPIGPVSLALRPYLRIDAVARADDELLDLFGDGASGGSVDFEGDAEAGVALDVGAALPLPVPPDPSLAGVWIGIRGGPFVGLAKAEADGSATVVLDPETSEPSYAYQAELFTGGVIDGGIGYGFEGDLGVAATFEAPEGSATVGVALNAIGVEVWPGSVRTVADDGDGDVTSGPATPETRTRFGEDLSLYLHAAYAPALEPLGVSALTTLLVAADIETDFGGVALHTGVEGGFGAGGVELLARAGLGFDDGLVAGVGGGILVSGVGFDVALHTYRSPLTLDTTVGVSAGLAFRY